MRALSVADQDAAIQRLFPAFRLTCPFDFMGKWRGPLRPLARTYEIGIAYFPRVHFAGAIIANPWITVEVLDPVIGLDPRGTGEMPPHIYPSPGDDVGLVTLPFRPEDGGLGAAPADRRDHHSVGSGMALLLRGLADRRPLGRRR